MISSSDSLSYQSLNLTPGINLSRFSTVNTRPLDLCKDEGFIYHSALPIEDFPQKLEHILKKIPEREKQDSALLFSLSGSEDPLIERIFEHSSPALQARISEWRLKFQSKIQPLPINLPQG
jgi:hypothetical protein